jgi:hypothetical protein
VVLVSLVVVLLSRFLVAGLRRLTGPDIARVLVTRPAGQRTDARSRPVHPGPGSVVLGGRTGAIAIEPVTNDGVVGVVATRIAVMAAGLGKGDRDTRTAGEQPRGHEAGRRGDAHTRTHAVTTLHGIERWSSR